MNRGSGGSGSCVRRRPRALPPLIAITDGERLGLDLLLDRLAAAFRGGLEMVQVRERGVSDGEYVRRFRAVRALAPPGTIVLANRRLHLAPELEADGVHVGGDPRAVASARKTLGGEAIVGYSAHSVEEIENAAEFGADYAAFSPVFPPSSKRSDLPPQGIAGLREACRRASIPVIALGGVTAGRCGELRRAGAAGVAAIGAVLDAPDPAAATARIIEAFEAAGAALERRREDAD